MLASGPELGEAFRALLSARGLARPDARPLYAYRFTKTEYEENATRLRRLGRAALADWYGSGLILAHVAEWFRREREGGHWDWIRPLGSIGLRYGPGCSVTYADVEDLVRCGLTCWRRPQPRGGERLLAVVRESGFPVAAIREDPRISAWLKHSVLSVERGFEVEQAVGAEAWRVSDRIAQALFEPAMNLCTVVVDLRANIPVEARSANPVAYLDANQPGWRDALPFDVEQEDVRILVERMVRLREPGGGALDVERLLTNDGAGSWTARASLILEGKLDLRRVPAGIAAALAEGRRLRIFPRPPFAEELVAVAAIETYEDEDEVFHDLRAFVTKFDAELPLETEARLLAQSGHGTVGEFVPSGGQALVGPVVALDVAEVDDAQQPRRLRVIGTSPSQTRKPVLALAIQPDTLPSMRFSEQPTDLGTCRGSGRRIMVFSGTATLDEDGASSSWRTSAERDFDARAILIGDLVPSVRETVYRGLPRLWTEKDGQIAAPRSTSLHWRPRGRGAWRPLPNAEPWGAIELAVIEDGELRYTTQAAVLPPAMKFEFDATRRELRIVGAGTAILGAFGARPLRIRSAGPNHLVELGAPSGTPIVTIRARWETEVALTFADPSYQLRLIDENDKLVSIRTMFALDALGGRRILATHEVSLCMELRAPDAPRLAISRPVSGEIPLSALRDTIRQLLGRSASLDASVVLSALGSSEHIAEVRWYAEDVNPFRAAPRDGRFAALATMNALDLRAVSLIDPIAGAQPVTAPASEVAIRAELEPVLPNGPWLMFGRRPSGEVVRPRIVPAIRIPAAAVTPLVRAITTNAVTERSRAFAEVYADPRTLSREDVRRLIDLVVLARREHLPASSIDALRALDQAPATAVHLLAACDDMAERAALLDLQRDLPFLWSATTIRSWLDAFEARYEAIRTELAEAGIRIDVARMVTNALREIIDIRPELAGHARAVFLSTVAAAAMHHVPIDGSTGPFLRHGPPVQARTEIDQLITRHQEGDAPLHSVLGPPTLEAQRRWWEPYLIDYAEVIAAPFAVAEHAAGLRILSGHELVRCRDASLYDPEFFEVILPMRTNALLNMIAQPNGAAA